MERLRPFRQPGRAKLNSTWMDQHENTKNKRLAETVQHAGQLAQLNRKQRREMTRQLQSEDLSLEVVHPDAAGIDIGNETHYVAVPPIRDTNLYVLRVHHSRTEADGRLAEAMRNSDDSYAIYWGLLDRGIRHS